MGVFLSLSLAYVYIFSPDLFAEPLLSMYRCTYIHRALDADATLLIILNGTLGLDVTKVAHAAGSPRYFVIDKMQSQRERTPVELPRDQISYYKISFTTTKIQDCNTNPNEVGTSLSKFNHVGECTNDFH